MAWIYLSRKWHEAEFLKCHRWTSAENNGNYHNELHWELEEEHMETRHDSHKQHLWHSVWRTLTQCVPAYSSPCAPVVLPATWLQNRSELPWNLLLIPVYTVHFHKYMNCVFLILNCPCWKQSVWYYGTGDQANYEMISMCNKVFVIVKERVHQKRKSAENVFNLRPSDM